jgi:hypothetical protein
VGIATPEEAAELFAACDRRVLLKTKNGDEAVAGSQNARELSLEEPDVWDRLLESVVQKG